jgi:hypothetical protein
MNFCKHQSTPTLSCKNEIVVTLSVGGGQTLGTDSLDFTISCVGRYLILDGIRTSPVFKRLYIVSL